MFHIYSPEHGPALVQLLRQAGYAATEFSAHGRDGAVVNSIVARKDIPAVRAIVEQANPAAFVTLESVLPLRRGYFRH